MLNHIRATTLETLKSRLDILKQTKRMYDIPAMANSVGDELNELVTELDSQISKVEDCISFFEKSDIEHFVTVAGGYETIDCKNCGLSVSRPVYQEQTWVKEPNEAGWWAFVGEIYDEPSYQGHPLDGTYELTSIVYVEHRKPHIFYVTEDKDYNTFIISFEYNGYEAEMLTIECHGYWYRINIPEVEKEDE